MTASIDAGQSVPVTGVQILWAVAAIIGLFGVGVPAAHAPDAANFLSDLRQSWSAVTVSMDLLLLGSAAVAFAVIKSRRLGMRWPWIWIRSPFHCPGHS